MNVWLLGATINTHVNPDGSHKFSPTETDLMYPPDWERFIKVIEETVRGSVAYLGRLQGLWSPVLEASTSIGMDLELFGKLGKPTTNFSPST